MSDITITFDDHGLAVALFNAASELNQAVFTEVVAGAADIQNSAVESIQKGTKTGRVYTHVFFMKNGKLRMGGARSGRNLSPAHRASSPGEAPATDTGALAAGIVLRYDREGMRAVVANTARHGLYLERGTGRIKPRPFLLPAADQHRDGIAARIRAAVEGTLP